jgi:UDP-N-acetylmuramyl pentapeptide phosphotransferase/UDP-N-acetylglucosamine-1-phosphate transferase
VPIAPAPLIWTGSALAVSALSTAGSIYYARHRKLIDQPGMRRSHSVPTPRGGGIGIVAAIVVCGMLQSITDRTLVSSWWLLPPILGIALVGWMDDHGGLSARKRFAMHCAAALWTFVVPVAFAGVLAPLRADMPVMPTGLTMVLALGIALAAVWSINLHNFMDGIDGILSLQSIFVFVVLAACIARAGEHANAWQLIIWSAAVAGFLPFNFPRPRIFMGDVGSGVLGFLVAIAVVWQVLTPGIAAATGIIACSAFVTDATCTLISRMLRGRRWYSAHREHLYQWLVRCGHSHARVVAFYMGWNLLIVLPVISWMNRSTALDSTRSGIGAAALVYALAVAVWLVGKRRCLATMRTRGRHATA